MSDPAPTEDAWQLEMRKAFGEALGAFMSYSNSMYKDTVNENEKLRKRVTYLEQRLAEEQAK